ncbi:hypothetical protein BGX26_003249 [Mortierella sp. AD094]|nr:hypothetical protein BGX26_003249 [Mortierella sp. AD094]
MYSSSKTKPEKYILIEEDAVPVEAHVDDSKAPKVVQLRNLAYLPTPVSDPSPSPSLSSPKDKKRNRSKILSRTEVLEALMPLSRVPWGTTPTLIDQKPRNSNRQ